MPGLISTSHVSATAKDFSSDLLVIEPIKDIEFWTQLLSPSLRCNSSLRWVSFAGPWETLAMSLFHRQVLGCNLSERSWTDGFPRAKSSQGYARIGPWLVAETNIEALPGQVEGA
jgi:hypothetical protein